MYGKLLAAALLATTVTGAEAMIGDNAFTSLERIRSQSSLIDVGRVRSEGMGMVEIYSMNSDGTQTLLGSQPVHAGANNNVRVHIGHPVQRDIVAVLRVDGQVVATREFDVIRR
ncbi:MAG: hypothetical protein ACU0E9_16325 [Limimaricola soesokkakensis]|uniref:Uncharacterized protein n=1 Tax=Limimaricola soesokkakensis TaxID=1343159 RepID=A0A1X6YAR5_9RHOB|nr:hypothetical protein [Limimaricola soesokkakensis]PSK87145.1 hypothetical protein CLV79_103194 [Limimaricola soesokkakensis]SLN15594.1 hypothetical protein LOS8367_00205 [Limimaricola soesokkakensis]